MWNDSIASSMDPLYHAFNTHMWLLFLQEWNLIWIMFVGIYTFDGYEFYQFCWFGKAMKSSVSLKGKKNIQNDVFSWLPLNEMCTTGMCKVRGRSSLV